MSLREYLLTTNDQELWEKYLPGRVSVYGSLGYALIGERLLNRITRLHVIESTKGWIAHPMHFRPLSQLPFAAQSEARWDIATPEFTGPLVFGEDETLIRQYMKSRNSLAQREGIVAEFAHLQPWSGAEQLLHDGSSLDRQIIWSDSTLTPEFLRRNHLEHRRRKCLNKAEREGMRVVEVGSPAEIREFVRIYQNTMSRNQAGDNYYFSEEYFLAFLQLLPGNSRFTLTIHQNRVIGALFIMIDDDNVYAYLGGSDSAFHHLNPATFQIWESICWAHRNGKKRVVLGGGHVANDGIFNFKASFSPLLQPFYTYKKVHRPEEYNRLEQACRTFHQLGNQDLSYFPSYRYIPKPSNQANPCSVPGAWEAEPDQVQA